MLTLNNVTEFINVTGDYFVSDTDNKMIAASKDISLSDAAAERLSEKIAGLSVDCGRCEWEFVDTVTRKYYKIKSSTVEIEGNRYLLHDLTDISEQIDVVRSVSSLSLDWEQSARFQTAMLSKLNQSYVNTLPDIAKQFGTDRVIMYLSSDKGCEEISYSAETGEICVKECVNAGEPDGFVCLAKGEAGSQSYTLLVRLSDDMDAGSLDDITLNSVVKLYIENSLLHSQVLWNNEHDSLTGLYNKGKYMALLKENFGSPDKITIFNMDVNNLKKMNDLFGHTAGDNLIIKAAKSLHMVSSDNVMGFRMGGDEFMLVAVGLSEEESGRLLEKWHSAVKKLNKAEDGIEIVIACGMVHAEGSYDLDELLERADKLMYEDKKRLKAQ